MKTIFDGYTPIETDGKSIYFAGANTASGFLGDYSAIADEKKLERVYIIKGGPGTGKSTLMRRCAELAEMHGFSAVRYLCGSDPDSLDCVVLDGRIAVLDGTAPHIRDMAYPGAASELIDVSRFWNSSLLEEKREELITFSGRKSDCYASAYRWLAAVQLLEKEKNICSEAVFLREKAEACVDRFIRKWKRPSAKKGAVHPVRTHALTMKGAVSVGWNAADHYTVADSFGCAGLFMELLAEKLTGAGYNLQIARLPAPDCIAGIYLEDVDAAVTVGEAQNAEHVINMTRFTSAEIPKGMRGEYRLTAKIQQSCLDEALRYLSKAAEQHFALEQIYVRAMNFDNLGQYTDTILSDLEKRLLRR